MVGVGGGVGGPVFIPPLPVPVPVSLAALSSLPVSVSVPVAIVPALGRRVSRRSLSPFLALSRATHGSPAHALSPPCRRGLSLRAPLSPRSPLSRSLSLGGDACFVGDASRPHRLLLHLHHHLLLLLLDRRHPSCRGPSCPACGRSLDGRCLSEEVEVGSERGVLHGEEMEGVGGPCWEEEGDSVCSAGDVVSWISSSWAARSRGSTPLRGPPEPRSQFLHCVPEMDGKTQCISSALSALTSAAFSAKQ